MTHFGNFWRVGVVTIAAVAHVGCAGLASLKSVPRVYAPPEDIGQVSLVVNAPPIAPEFQDVPPGKDAAARRQAWRFFVACQPSGGGGGGGGPFAVLAFLVWEAVCITGAGVSAIVGASKAHAEDEVDAMTASAQGTMAELAIAQDLVAEIERAAERIVPGRLVSSTIGVDGPGAGPAATEHELRVELTRLGFEGVPEHRKLHYLVMEVRAAVVDVASGEVVKSKRISHYSEPRTLEAWVENDGQYITAAIARGYPRLGEGVVDYAFMLYPFPHQGAAHGWTYFRGLHAESPPHQASKFKPGVPHVHNSRPTFSWQSFPREVDVAKAPEAMQQVTNVSYELLISIVDQGTAGEVVYRKAGLPTNSHTIEVDLEPAQAYLWTVRAGFEVDGRRYVTEWAQRGKLGFFAPSTLNFAFLTAKSF
jgi:hypothetical protein